MSSQPESSNPGLHPRDVFALCRWKRGRTWGGQVRGGRLRQGAGCPTHTAHGARLEQRLWPHWGARPSSGTPRLGRGPRGQRQGWAQAPRAVAGHSGTKRRWSCPRARDHRGGDSSGSALHPRPRPAPARPPHAHLQPRSRRRSAKLWEASEPYGKACSDLGRPKVTLRLSRRLRSLVLGTAGTGLCVSLNKPGFLTGEAVAGSQMGFPKSGALPHPSHSAP